MGKNKCNTVSDLCRDAQQSNFFFKYEKLQCANKKTKEGLLNIIQLFYFHAREGCFYLN